MNNQRGFTMIELVVVIVILGILAAVALPKFADLSTKAKSGALSNVAGSITSASAVNYAACKAGAADCQVVANCSDAASLMLGGLPTGYTVTAALIGAGVSLGCTVTQTDGGATASATVSNPA